MKVEFIKVNPVENMTILIKSPCNRENYGKISQQLMKYSSIYAEQVGFIEGKHLQMMGGEFCGNASRSFAAYLAFSDETFCEEKKYKITCSGCSEQLLVWVRQAEKENQFLAKIAMPKILFMQEDSVILGKKRFSLSRVALEGIVHFIVENTEEKEEIIMAIMKKMDKEEYEALGIMFFEKEENRMTPYVYVKGLGEVWERSCASGTTALGYYLREKYQIQRANIQEPGGYLEVSFEGEQIFIDGLVEIVAEGVVYLK